MSFEVSCNLRFNVIEISYHLRFSVIWYFVSFYISCQLTFRVIWHFVSFISLWQLTFPVIWQFMSFDISFDLGNLSHYSNHTHQSHLGINPSCYRGPVCAQKVGCCIVIGRYGYKSSFGAKKTPCIRLNLKNMRWWFPRERDSPDQITIFSSNFSNNNEETNFFEGNFLREKCWFM